MSEVSDADRELAREWAKKELGVPLAEGDEYAFLAGLEHGRLTWTGEPPAVAEPHWWRMNASSPGYILFLSMIDGVLWVDTPEDSEEVSVYCELYPACQWSPIPAPREPT